MNPFSHLKPSIPLIPFSKWAFPYKSNFARYKANLSTTFEPFTVSTGAHHVLWITGVTAVKTSLTGCIKAWNVNFATSTAQNAKKYACQLSLRQVKFLVAYLVAGNLDKCIGRNVVFPRNPNLDSGKANTTPELLLDYLAQWYEAAGILV